MNQVLVQSGKVQYLVVVCICAGSLKHCFQLLVSYGWWLVEVKYGGSWVCAVIGACSLCELQRLSLDGSTFSPTIQNWKISNQSTSQLNNLTNLNSNWNLAQLKYYVNPYCHGIALDWRGVQKYLRLWILRWKAFPLERILLLTKKHRALHAWTFLPGQTTLRACTLLRKDLVFFSSSSNGSACSDKNI